MMESVWRCDLLLWHVKGHHGKAQSPVRHLTLQEEALEDGFEEVTDKYRGKHRHQEQHSKPCCLEVDHLPIEYLCKLGCFLEDASEGWQHRDQPSQLLHWNNKSFLGKLGKVQGTSERHWGVTSHFKVFQVWANHLSNLDDAQIC